MESKTEEYEFDESRALKIVGFYTGKNEDIFTPACHNREKEGEAD